MHNGRTGDDMLKEVFRESLQYALLHNKSVRNLEAVRYVEREILRGFISADDLYKIRYADNKRFDDIADMLYASDVRLGADSFEGEIKVHKHIGDYTLFMLGMFRQHIARKQGKEFLLGQIVVPKGNLIDHYMLQGRRSYGIVAEIERADVFVELTKNYKSYLNLLELVRIHFEASQKKKNIIIGN